MRKGQRSVSGKKGRSAGFSLIEVTIAMVVLGIGLLSAAQMIPLAMAGVTQARVRTNAVQEAQERLDDLMANDFDDAALNAGTYTETVGNYNLTWTITDNNPVPGSKRIELTTSWTTVTGAQDASFTTYLSGGR
jgi:type IV pilus assembly protein PilV